MGRVVLGGIAGGIVVFVWGAIAHMALPIGTMGIRQIPSEEKVLGTMKDAIREPGLYFFPGMDMTKQATKEEEKAYEAKLKQGPSGILVIRPDGDEGITPHKLGIEAGSNIVAALLAAFVLSQVQARYPMRVLVVTLIGVFGFVSISVSYWNWYNFPSDFTLGEAITETVGWFLAGLVMAAIVRPVKEPAPL
jgi:hypothetical protein